MLSNLRYKVWVSTYLLFLKLMSVLNYWYKNRSKTSLTKMNGPIQRICPSGCTSENTHWETKNSPYGCFPYEETSARAFYSELRDPDKMPGRVFLPLTNRLPGVFDSFLILPILHSINKRGLPTFWFATSTHTISLTYYTVSKMTVYQTFDIFNNFLVKDGVSLFLTYFPT